MYTINKSSGSNVVRKHLKGLSRFLAMVTIVELWSNSKNKEYGLARQLGGERHLRSTLSFLVQSL